MAQTRTNVLIYNLRNGHQVEIARLECFRRDVGCGEEQKSRKKTYREQRLCAGLREFFSDRVEDVGVCVCGVPPPSFLLRMQRTQWSKRGQDSGRTDGCSHPPPDLRKKGTEEERKGRKAERLEIQFADQLCSSVSLYFPQKKKKLNTKQTHTQAHVNNLTH